jgi:hypothetical protein
VLYCLNAVMQERKRIKGAIDYLVINNSQFHGSKQYDISSIMLENYTAMNCVK